MHGKRKKRLADYKILGVIIPVGLLLLWQVASLAGLLNPSILPSPSKLFAVLVEMGNEGTLLKHITMSLKRVGIGYVVGASFGVILGVILGLSPLVKRFLSVMLEILRPVPILAWVPVLIVFCGIGETSKVIAIAIGSFWSVLLNTTDGVRNVDIKYKEVAEIFTKNKKDTVVSVILPAALPSIFTGLRIGIGSAWLSVIGSEMIASSSGLGYFITYNREMMRPDKVYVGVFTIGIIGWLINILIRKIENRLLKWNAKGKE
ncbi:ABC transporter permease [Roseburia sp. 499]|uniref:ABC transporter permease n=1 Tax=Roseburia sp. 499 TaxID=1261634 RepID=UPI00095215D1|nr:ABC transporter permease [Roseburia sp. 499]WVK69514.1 ABC transporter permease [Roseburia sp. 499]